jgi:alcohol dehydrogenase (cytochrome c)
MNEGGTNQPAPIVHNGIIYLANTGGILQAIDGTNGKLIWKTGLPQISRMRGDRHSQRQDLLRDRVSAVRAREVLET